MKDKLLMFGEATGATKNTVAYGADVLDLGACEFEGNLENLCVCAIAKTSNASVDSVAIQLYESDDNSTFTLLQQGENHKYEAGEKHAMPFPKKHKRYLKAGILPSSTGTFTSTVYELSLQFGVQNK